MLTDLVLNPFGADMHELLDMACAADDGRFGALWVTDHFSGAVVGAPWSRDPFVSLGAIATVTDRVDIGLLVANVNNRHPVQLASAINSVQSLAPGRVRLGVGSGAAPGSKFAVEHHMIGRRLGDASERRALLRSTLDDLRAAWAGECDGVVDGALRPPLVVGASAWATIEVAIELADGVNIRRTQALPEQLERLAAADLPDGFEVSVLDMYDPKLDGLDPPQDLLDAGVDRWIVTMGPGEHLAVVAR